MDAQERNGLDREDLIDLFHVLSHDLKSPIFSIDGFSDLLVSDYADALEDEGRDFVNRIRSGSLQMKATLDGFNRVLRLLPRPNETEVIDLDDLVGEVFEDLSGLAEESGVSLGADDGMPKVLADRTKVKEALSALVSNAIVFRDPDRDEGFVRIGHSSTDGVVEISVKDDGMGIAPAHHEQIFDAGLRLDKSRGARAGCGLYLARRVAESHGGTLTVESSESDGSTFVLTLPRA
ncbi:MAG: HAMP domain-containing sensor histidine kinase [Thermoanaerobaculia bacterium]|nr:HAMP domain-containing sensor histidine kinase [Thermoanaerobaculia bacterium]